MSIAAVWLFTKNLLDSMTWPPAMSGLPPLNTYILPPDPNVQLSQPVAYVWGGMGEESRRLEVGGALNRAAYPGGPSGTKGVVHQVMIYMTWSMQASDTSTDPYGNADTDTLFPGMVEAVKTALRTAPLASDVIDPWTSVKSSVVDIGEVMRHELFVRDAEAQAMKRYDGFIECSVTEIILG